MKTKQYSAKIFEVELEDEVQFITFFEKNSSLFQNHLIVINGEENQNIKKYLDSKNLHYTFNLKLPKKNAKKSTQQPLIQKDDKDKEKKSVQKNLQVSDKLIRSGQELKIDGDLLFLGRINSGGTITVSGSLIIIQPVDGSIRCNGNFMMLQASQKANIVFHDVEVDNAYLQNKLSRVELIENEIVITPVLKETSWV
ncbi:Probable septum site-determining protein minC [hydrothermal vent metagenome]|uniref:Probable septum site-determining protein minC n=1 Tax=hydrothermal vent metagenome TaxID=652676 RepID=A0A1W1D274_9ZZZZ